MPTFATWEWTATPHLRYFEARCMAKGATKKKAREWARRQVYIRGRRKP